jgi:hypothetical protein
MLFSIGLANVTIFIIIKNKTGMKKILTVFGLSLVIWGCAKKIAPVKSEAPSSNIGSTSTNNSGTVTTTSSTTNTPPNNTTPQPYDQKSPGKLEPLDVSKLSTEEASKVAGQMVFNAKCNKCHQYKVISDYTDLRWVQIVQVMAIKANLSETDKSNLLAYVRAGAKKG